MPLTKRQKLVAGYGAVALLALAAVVAIVLRRGGDEPPPVVATTTTTTAPGPPWPLTGVPSLPGDPIDRPALAVKVSNGSTARPQAGINAADQVWEEQVEGISRLIAVFHSTDAVPVGPIRSARDSDVDLLGAFGTPVFVWGGGNEGVAARVASSPLVSFNVDPDVAEDKYRDPDRPAPDNLFIDGTEPFFAADGGSPAVAQFAYRTDDGPLPGSPALGAEVDWGGSLSSWLWDDQRQGWRRFQDGSAHVDADGEPVVPPNVVLLVTPYGSAPSDPRSPVGLTVGEGEATVLTAGRQIQARWSRSDGAAPYVITDAATGAVVELTAGTTWVALAPPGRSAFVDEARATELRAQIDPSA